MLSCSTIVMLALLLQPTTAPASDAEADALAAAVMKASGADVWPKVKRIKFTFNVDREGTRVMSAQHDWDLRAGTDTVTWGERTVTVDVTRDDHEGDEKAAYARFINDSYWLLAPLKVMDGGVIRSTGASQEIGGREYLLLHLSFESVGLTPTDRYNLWIDPETKLVRHWDYIPKPGSESRMSWDEYQDFSGLKLSTKHQSETAAIVFTDVSVEIED